MLARPRQPHRSAGALLALCVLLGGCSATTRDPRPPVSAAPDAGRQLFARERCGSCHTLAAAGARGRSGPDLDSSERLNRAQLRVSLVEGANGMPSFAGRLDARQLDTLADFLYRATHDPAGG